MMKQHIKFKELDGLPEEAMNKLILYLKKSYGNVVDWTDKHEIHGRFGVGEMIEYLGNDLEVIDRCEDGWVIIIDDSKNDFNEVERKDAKELINALWEAVKYILNQ